MGQKIHSQAACTSSAHVQAEKTNKTLIQREGKISVLVVDDEPVMLEIVRLFLEKEDDITVITRESVNDALEILEEFHFDVIVSDYNMPWMSGYDFLKELRGCNNYIPFILFTSFSRDCIERELFRDETIQYLHKNNEPEPLFESMIGMIRSAMQQ